MSRVGSGTTSSKRPSYLFLSVYTSVFVAIAEAASDCFVNYDLMVTGWGDPLVLLEPTLTNAAASVQNSIVPLFAVLREFHCPTSFRPIPEPVIPSAAIFVQCFFTWRIWTFSMAACGRTTKRLVAIVCLFILLVRTLILLELNLTSVFLCCRQVFSLSGQPSTWLWCVDPFSSRDCFKQLNNLSRSFTPNPPVLVPNTPYL